LRQNIFRKSGSDSARVATQMAKYKTKMMEMSYLICRATALLGKFKVKSNETHSNEGKMNECA
jgi:hypothetical protein